MPKLHEFPYIAPCSVNGDADCMPEAMCIDSTDGDRFICVCPTGLMGDGRINGSGCMADECSTIADCAENTSRIDSIDGLILSVSVRLASSVMGG